MVEVLRAHSARAWHELVGGTGRVLAISALRSLGPILQVGCFHGMGEFERSWHHRGLAGFRANWADGCGLGFEHLPALGCCGTGVGASRDLLDLLASSHGFMRGPMSLVPFWVFRAFCGSWLLGQWVQLA